MERVQKSFYEEREALPFTECLIDLWPKQIALNWFWTAFQALENSGLTYFETELEETKVQERLSALAVLYYEMCHISAKHESSNFSHWREETINEIKNDLTDEADDRLFEVKQALIKYFGSEEKVLAELWINFLEGSTNCIIKMEEKIKLYELIINERMDDVNFIDLRDWFIGWTKGIEEYEGIAI